MNDHFVAFDSVRGRVADVLGKTDLPSRLPPFYLVRNLRGRVRISVSEAEENDAPRRAALRELAGKLADALGPHGFPADDAVLFVGEAMLAMLQEAARPMAGLSHVYWVDRLLTGSDWWTVREPLARATQRYTLYSVKGGVGRSTTAAVLAWHLARKGEKVLVIDLDLESPGLSTAVLEPSAQPQLGVVDWFVEDLVGQGEAVLERMTASPAWRGDFEGDVCVVPAHGREPGEYLAKLGRAYMGAGDTWNERLRGLLIQLEERCEPTVVLVESRSGLHDIAAATVTDIEAQVLLFGVDSESSWADYDMLFRHWQVQDLAADIRERLSIVSALTPLDDSIRYLDRFLQRSWNLFQSLYDCEAGSSRSPSFGFDVNDTLAPHQPLPIYWNRGLAAGASLRQVDEVPVHLAYTPFLRQFDELAQGMKAPLIAVGDTLAKGSTP